MLLRNRPSPPPKRIGTGLVGKYSLGPDGTRRFEGPRPAAGWHRHGWRRRCLKTIDENGTRTIIIERRRWLQFGTTTTQQDRSPDELGGVGSTLLVVFLQLCAWLLSESGLHTYEDRPFAPAAPPSRRTVHRWLHRLLPDAERVQGALRTAAIECSEPQPIERLFPGGLSPPEAIRCRRWKDRSKTYLLAMGLAFLAHGADALNVSATVLLAVAQQGIDGPLGTSRR